jgi:hypothetical protein
MQNVWVLLALQKYFLALERDPPNFELRTWLDENFLGQHSFEERTNSPQVSSVPLWVLAMRQMTQSQASLISGSGSSSSSSSSDSGSTMQLAIRKNGTGRCYYRVAMNYSPAVFDLQPLDRGFTIKRVYETVDDPAEYVNNPNSAIGFWRLIHIFNND